MNKLLTKVLHLKLILKRIDLLSLGGNLEDEFF